MSYTRDDLLQLLELVGITQVEEIDCDEFLERAAGYIERLGPGRAVPDGYEDVVQHLRICPECLEEFQLLYRELRGEG